MVNTIVAWQGRRNAPHIHIPFNGSGPSKIKFHSSVQPYFRPSELLVRILIFNLNKTAHRGLCGDTETIRNNNRGLLYSDIHLETRSMISRVRQYSSVATSRPLELSVQTVRLEYR